jgi:hypothetical protein
LQLIPQWIAAIPPELFDAVKSQTPLTINIAVTDCLNGTGEGVSDGYDSASISIEVFRSSDRNELLHAFAHEFGHVFHHNLSRNQGFTFHEFEYAYEDVVDASGYSGPLLSIFDYKWDDFNQGILYRQTWESRFSDIFTRSYALYSRQEDIAETFDVLIMGTTITGRKPKENTPLAQKAQYLRRWVDMDVHGASAWAAEDIRRYSERVRELNGAMYGKFEISRIIFCCEMIYTLSKIVMEKYDLSELSKVIGYDEVYRIILPNEKIVNPGTGELRSYDVWHSFSDKVLNSPSILPDQIMENYPANAVRIANAFGIANGESDTYFNTEGDISRQEAAAMLYRMCKVLGYSADAEEVEFADSSEIAPWAKEAVNFVVSAGVMNGTGDNNFSPKSNYTFEQTYATMMRIYDLVLTEK